MSNTVQCHSCGVALHIGDEASCPCCGGEIASPKVQQVRLELEALAKEDSKEVF